MSEDKRIYYRQISWQQDYNELDEIVDFLVDCLIEQTEYKEAKEVIENIKGKL